MAQQVKTCSPDGTWDALLHRVSSVSKFVLLSQLRNEPLLTENRGQRAIGVVYDPSAEAGSYVPTRLTERYDGLIFIDRTQALTPLPVEPQARKNQSKAPMVGTYALISD